MSVVGSFASGIGQAVVTQLTPTATAAMSPVASNVPAQDPNSMLALNSRMINANARYQYYSQPTSTTTKVLVGGISFILGYAVMDHYCCHRKK